MDPRGKYGCEQRWTYTRLSARMDELWSDGRERVEAERAVCRDERWDGQETGGHWMERSASTDGEMMSAEMDKAMETSRGKGLVKVSIKNWRRQ